jgi:hypothetical protein
MAIKYLKPSGILLRIFLCFNLLPAAYIYVFHYHVNWFDASLTDAQNKIGSFYYLFTSLAFIICYISSLFIFDKKYALLELNIVTNTSPNEVNHGIKQRYIDKLVLYLGWISCCIVLVYFISGGYLKLSLVGKDTVRGMAFRLIGFDENRILIALLAIVRKVILPFCCVYLWSIKRDYGIKYKSVYVFLSTFLFSGIMTLDRYPILIFMCLSFYLYYTEERTIRQRLIACVSGFLLLIFVGGFLNLIQVNKTDITYRDVALRGSAFLWKRAFIEPSVASIELALCKFPMESDKLFFKYSRLGALIGRPYVTTNDINGQYVAPVGCVGDCWRNLGFIGCLVLAVTLGGIFSYLDASLLKVDTAAKLAISFTCISFSFHLIYGNIFSQGGIFYLFFLIIIPLVILKNVILKTNASSKNFTHFSNKKN